VEQPWLLELASQLRSWQVEPGNNAFIHTYIQRTIIELTLLSQTPGQSQKLNTVLQQN